MSADVYQYLGTPVLIKKMYTTKDVADGIAQKVATFDYVMGQSEYWGDVLSHGVGICSIETQPNEWFGAEDPNNPDIFTIIESDTQPYPWFVNAPKYRGYGPGFLTYVILPDRPEDQWKLSDLGALTRLQTATIQLPYYPEVGNNDVIIVVSTDQQGRITETYERYQLKQMSPVTMHGIDRGGARAALDGPLTANNNRYTSTIQYTTFIKRWAVESLQDGFANHISKRVQATKIGYAFNTDEYTLPAVLVKYVERDSLNAGVGHEEWLPSPYDPNPSNPSIYMKYYHRLYHGQITFEAYAQSSTDCGLVRDALAEMLMMTDSTPWGNNFIQRLYFYMNQTPYGYFNLPFLNTDQVYPINEQTKQLPWAPEDKFAYCAGYSIEVMGDLYSATPNAESNITGTSLIDQVDLTVTETSQLNNPDATISTDFYQFTGFNSADTEI
ncbi:unnamed protein product [Sphagnum balticum]